MTEYQISDGAKKIMEQEAERLKSVPKGIAAKLIGCNAGLVSKYISAGRLRVLPNGELATKDIEKIAARPICPFEIQLCEAELDLQNQLLSVRARRRILHNDFSDEWSEEYAND